MGARGEGVIHTKKGDIDLLFTNRALLVAEKQLGKGILNIVKEFAAGNGGYTELVALMRAGIEAARQDSRTSGRPVSNNDAIDILDEVGFTAAIQPVMEAIAAVISYNVDTEDAGEDNSDPN